MSRSRLTALLVTLLLLLTTGVSADGPPLYNWLGSHREDSASAVFWSEGMPSRAQTGNLGPMLNSQRIVNPQQSNPAAYLFHNFFSVSVTGGNVTAQSAVGAFARSTAGHNLPGGRDVTAISSHARTEGGSTARTYAGWDSAWNFSRQGQSIGRETDAVNATGAMAPATLGPGATTGLAIAGLVHGAGSQYNTYGLLFQSAPGAAFRTGIYFEPHAVVEHGETLRIPNETWIAAWNPTDTGVVNIVAVDGLGNVRLRIPNEAVVMFDDAAGIPRVTIDSAGRLTWQGGWSVYGDEKGLWAVGPGSVPVRLAGP